MTNKHEHGGVSHAAKKVQDVAGGVAGKISAKMVGNAGAFVENAAIGDLYERRAAVIALTRAKSEQLKWSARQMLNDHTTSTHQLQSALEMNETRGVPAPPRELDSRRAKMIEHLETAPADKFDKTYVEQQVLAHAETVTLMNGYSKKGDNPQLVSFALSTAPVVERHLTRMKALKQQMA